MHTFLYLFVPATELPVPVRDTGSPLLASSTRRCGTALDVGARTRLEAPQIISDDPTLVAVAVKVGKWGDRRQGLGVNAVRQKHGEITRNIIKSLKSNYSYN